MPDTMKIEIDVTLTGTQKPNGEWKIDDLYAATVIDPPGISAVVRPNGDIYLTEMNPGGRFGNDTAISFRLAQINVTDKNGAKADVKFWSPVSEAISFDPKPIQGELGAPSSGDGWLSFVDPDTNGKTYKYHLYLSCNGERFKLDPSLVNRTGR